MKLWDIDFSGANNVYQRGDSLMKNKTLTELDLVIRGLSIRPELKRVTEHRTTELRFT